MLSRLARIRFVTRGLALMLACVALGLAGPVTAGAPDTLEVTARLVEIAGTFAPNDLYNYVYVMKYRVLKVIAGSYDRQEILVGHYNPLIPRSKITDAMKKNVSGTVDKFEVGARHRLVLVSPLEHLWNGATEDEYSDRDDDKFFAVVADKVP